MIELWYLNTKDISELDMLPVVNSLPINMAREIMRFRNHEDRRLKLFGKMIVKKYHQHNIDSFSWSNWLTAEGGKPAYAGGKQFNISHSGDFVAVAFSDKKIGLDIEKCADFDMDAITGFLHPQEKEFIDRSEDVSDAFYTVWTRKEAYLKAKGIGITQGLNNENCLDSHIVADENWFLTSLSTIPKYKLALCSAVQGSKIDQLELNLTEF